MLSTIIVRPHVLRDINGTIQKEVHRMTKNFARKMRIRGRESVGGCAWTRAYK